VETPNFVKKKIDNKLELFYKKCHKMFWFSVVLMVVIGMFYFGCLAIHAFSGKAPLELIYDDVPDKKYFKNNFDEKEIKEWEGYENIETANIENKIFKPKITENFLGGRDIFFPEPWNPHFHVSLSFVPQNEEMINVALNYGYLFRVIVGNGDYNQVQMQYNSRYPNKNLKKSDWKEIGETNQEKWIKRNGRLETKKKIIFSITSRPEYNSNKIFVDVVISGILRDLSKREDFTFSYEINTDRNSLEYNEFIGIGLLDPLEDGVETQLDNFEFYKL